MPRRDGGEPLGAAPGQHGRQPAPQQLVDDEAPGVTGGAVDQDSFRCVHETILGATAGRGRVSETTLVRTVSDMPRIALVMHGSAMLYEAAIAAEIFGVDRSDLSPSGEWYDLVVCTADGAAAPLAAAPADRVVRRDRSRRLRRRAVHRRPRRGAGPGARRGAAGGARARRADRVAVHRRLRAGGGRAARRPRRDHALDARRRPGPPLPAGRRAPRRALRRRGRRAHLGGQDGGARPLHPPRAPRPRRRRRQRDRAATGRARPPQRRAGAVHHPARRAAQPRRARDRRSSGRGPASTSR